MKCSLKTDLRELDEIVILGAGKSPVKMAEMLLEWAESIAERTLVVILLVGSTIRASG